MSRTDKTRPYWVKRRDYPVEKHNHVKGYCNLPDDPGMNHPGFIDREDCWWDADWYAPEMRCPCKMCHGCDWAKAEGRTARYAGKKECREWWKE